jgi:hypothetical protein
MRLYILKETVGKSPWQNSKTATKKHLRYLRFTFNAKFVNDNKTKKRKN